MRGVKIIDYCIWIVNVQELIPNEHPRFLEEGPKLLAKTAQDSLTYGSQSTASSLVESLWVMGVGIYLDLASRLPAPSLLTH